MRKILAFLIIIALVFPLILASELIISVNSFILDRNFYIQSLADQKVYDSLLSGDNLSGVIGEYIPLPPETDFSKVEAVLRSVISREYLSEQIGVFVNGFFDYIQGKTDTFAPVVNLVPIKTALSDAKMDELLSAIAAVLPACAPGQVPGIDIESHTACKPQGLSDEVLAQDYIKPVFPLILSQIPDEVPVGGNWNEIQVTRNWGPFKPGMALPASLMLISIIMAFVAASFWYIAALIADESWRVRLLWLGWTLIIPSALVLLAGIAIFADIPRYWINLGLERASLSGIPFNSGIREALRAVINSSLARVANSLLMVGGISSAAGLCLIFWGLATKRKS